MVSKFILKTAIQPISAQALWKTLYSRVMGRKFVRDVGILTVGNVAGAALNLIQGILVARWLGPELYGVAALVMTYPGLVYTFFDARSSEASVKYMSEFHVRRQREQVLAMCTLGYVVDFGVAFLAFIFVLTTAGWAADQVAHDPQSVVLLIVFSVAFIPRALVGTSYAVLATLGRFSLIAWIDALANVLRVALVLTFVLSGWQVTGVVWGNAIASAITGIAYGVVGYALMQRTWGGSPLAWRWQTLKGYRREILRFLVYNDLNALLGMIPKQLDMVLLGYYRNPTEVGYYKLAKSLSAVVGYLVGPMQSVIYPELARLWGLGDRQALRRSIRRLALQIGAPGGLVILASTVLVPPILPVLVGQSFREAVTATQVSLVGSAVWLALFWLRPLYFARGELKAWSSISVCSASMTVLGLLYVVPSWGYLGVATWIMFAQIVGHSLAVAYLIKVRRNDRIAVGTS